MRENCNISIKNVMDEDKSIVGKHIGVSSQKYA